jgi:hypothetical protein
MSVIRDAGVAIGAAAGVGAFNGVIIRKMVEGNDSSAFVLPTLTTLGTGVFTGLMGIIGRSQGASGVWNLLLPAGIGIGAGALIGAVWGLSGVSSGTLQLAPGAGSSARPAHAVHIA